MEYTREWAITVWNEALAPHGLMACGVCGGTGAAYYDDDVYECDMCEGVGAVPLGEPITMALARADGRQKDEILSTRGEDVNGAYLSQLGDEYNGWGGAVDQASELFGVPYEGMERDEWLAALRPQLESRCKDWSFYSKYGSLLVIWK